MENSTVTVTVTEADFINQDQFDALFADLKAEMEAEKETSTVEEFSVGANVRIDGMLGYKNKSGIQIDGVVTKETAKAIQVKGTTFFGGYEMLVWFPKSVLIFDEKTENVSSEVVFEYNVKSWFIRANY